MQLAQGRFKDLSEIFLTLLILICLPTRPQAQSTQSRVSAELPGSKSAYGLTHDGNNFWFSAPEERRLYRVSMKGEVSSFFIANIRMYGLKYNPANGLLYLGSERKILRINPITGGINDSIPVPVKRIAGIGIGPQLLYLLEKGNGIIHYFDPGLGRIIDSLHTGNHDLRDIAIYHGYFWLTDGKDSLRL